VADVFSGGRVARGVVLCLLLTAVAPPAGATLLARWRVSRAASLAESTAVTLAGRMAELRDLAGEAGVVTGPGRLPRASEAGAGWVQNPVDVSATAIGTWPTDPWGRCYLVSIGPAARGGRGLVISAGPNGEIDTLLGAGAASGDDIGAAVR
jgi:hypothetical protein